MFLTYLWNKKWTTYILTWIQVSCCWSYLAFADNKEPDSFPLLSVVIQTDSGHHIEMADSQGYIKTLKRDVANSILSPKQMWAIARRHSTVESDYRYFSLFHQWYLTELPIIIFTYKLSKGNTVASKVVEDAKGEKLLLDSNGVTLPFFPLVKEGEFLFDPKIPFTSEQMITLASRYNYTYFEKLNLFLFALYRNISEEELLKLFKAWGIYKNIAVYIRDYEIYIQYFFEKLIFTQQSNRKYVRRLFNRNNQPLTSVLHESMNSHRVAVFNEITGDNKIDVNIQDYLLQTVLHKVANMEWSRGSFYISALLNHPNIYVNIPDFQNQTAIFYAIANSQDDHFPAVEKFLDHEGVRLDILNNKRKTLTLFAAELGMPRLSQILHEHGAPLPTKVSLENSFIFSNYQTVWFRYRWHLDLDELAHIFDASDTGSFARFQKGISEIKFVNRALWESFQYYFLLQFLQNLLSKEEKARSDYIMSVLFDNKRSVRNNSIEQAIRAIYRGDVSGFSEIFSKEKEGKGWWDTPFLNIKYLFEENSFPPRIILGFNMLERLNIKPLVQSDGNLAFYARNGSFLNEAIRSTQVEIVLFLLGQGVDPTIDRPGFILRDSIMLLILMNDLVYENKSIYENYLRIVNLLMSHPSVTKSFLEKEVVPGLNYVDLATIKGNLYAVKWMYRKGARVSDTSLWNTKVSAEIASMVPNFLRTSEFVLKEKIKDNLDDRVLKKQLGICQRAFH